MPAISPALRRPTAGRRRPRRRPRPAARVPGRPQRAGVRGAGPPARADGAGRLPPGARQPARRRRRLPGDLPGAGAKAKTVGHPDRLPGWLHTIAVRTATEVRRMRDRRRKLEASGGRQPPEADTPHSPEQSELAALLDEELAKLPGTLPRPRRAVRAARAAAPGGRRPAQAPRGDALQPAGQGPQAARRPADPPRGDGERRGDHRRPHARSVGPGAGRAGGRGRPRGPDTPRRRPRPSTPPTGW